jgi:hypothetical protein
MFSFLSRDEHLTGLPARRANRLLFAIESRTAHLALRARQAGALSHRTIGGGTGTAIPNALAQTRENNRIVRIQEPER